MYFLLHVVVGLMNHKNGVTVEKTLRTAVGREQGVHTSSVNGKTELLYVAPTTKCNISLPFSQFEGTVKSNITNINSVS